MEECVQLLFVFNCLIDLLIDFLLELDVLVKGFHELRVSLVELLNSLRDFFDVLFLVFDQLVQVSQEVVQVTDPLFVIRPVVLADLDDDSQPRILHCA